MRETMTTKNRTTLLDRRETERNQEKKEKQSEKNESEAMFWFCKNVDNIVNRLQCVKIIGIYF